MATSPPTFRSNTEFALFTAQLLRWWINGFDQGKIRLHVPKGLGLMQEIPGFPFHLTAELFFQISGITNFEFPEERFDVGPGEICLVPPGMPHRERVRPYKNEAFFNLVFHYSGEFFRFHAAREIKKGEPVNFCSHLVHGLGAQQLQGHLKTVAEWFHKKDPARALAVKCALLDHLFVILNAMENPTVPCETSRATEIEATVADHLSNPDLSVKWIACRTHMSPDHVSRLFRKATGKSLAAFIIRQRLEQAKHLLETSSLNISEISRAVGYENCNFFSKLFRRANGVPPRRYREELNHGGQKETAMTTESLSQP